MKKLTYSKEHFTLEPDPKIAHEKYKKLLNTPQQLHRYNLLLNKLLCINEDIKDKKILDYGCGVGYFAVLFAKYGAKQVVGIDISVNAIRSAIWYAKKEKVDDRCKFIVAKTPSVIKDNEKFDVLFLKDIIEHIPDDKYFFKEIIKNLHPGGRLIITTPNIWSISYLIGYLYNKVYLRNVDWVGGDDPTHVRLYSPPVIKKILKELNVEINKWISGNLIPYDIFSWLVLLKYDIKCNWVKYFDILGRIFPFKYLGYDLYIKCKLKK
jgi:2-polyprenyl-3-methyl-5-hydroxy-6-metoxy-1,4-benzoquinol methylase